ncbi:uncharacterized protein LOC134283304 [Saccostrea cucullata]|uniref:uncharacterized protein LOC134283304 n=1 Tax=Saccostrea cuccullata TaxID=36930 RepID=UPI002ED37D67
MPYVKQALSLLQNVGVTGSADYIDLDAPTSSLVQGAYSTLYPDEMGASTKTKSKSDGDRPDVTEETTYNGYSKQQLKEMVSNQKSSTDAIKCLFKALFSVGELTISSVTGKKTVKAKDGLQESRRQCVEVIIQEKFPKMALKDIRNKMRDRLKLFRRSHLPPPTTTDKTN